jgi:hypothetical protein
MVQSDCAMIYIGPYTNKSVMNLSLHVIPSHCERNFTGKPPHNCNSSFSARIILSSSFSNHLLLQRTEVSSHMSCCNFMFRLGPKWEEAYSLTRNRTMAQPDALHVYYI